MKKIIIWSLIALISGAMLGKFTFDKYEDLKVEKVISFNNNVYLLKYGTYDNEEEMKKRILDIERYIYIKENNKVYAYVAISTKKDNINKIKSIYEKKKINLKIDKRSIDNDEFIQNLNEYEKLLSATDNENSLLTIENQILSSYEELVVNDD